MWDPENVIQINLDPKHFVYISPNSIVEGNPTEVYYQRRTEEFAIACNHDCLVNASKWLIGKPGTLVKAINLIEEFNLESQQAKIAFNSIVEKATYLERLNYLITQYGPFHSLSILQVMEMNKLDLFKQDPAFQDALNQYKEKGVSINV